MTQRTMLKPHKNSFLPAALAGLDAYWTNHSMSGRAFAQPPVRLLPFFSSFTVCPASFHLTTSGDVATSGSMEVRPCPL